MSFNLHLGPLRVGTRSMGVRVGPVSASAGYRRRRSGLFAEGELLMLFVGSALVVTAVYFAVHYWYVTLAVVAVLAALSVPIIKSRSRRQREQAHADYLATIEWLDSDPEPPVWPSRFTDAWFGRNVTQMHPQHIKQLCLELQSRKWTDDRIEARVLPYINANPYMQFLEQVVAEDDAAAAKWSGS